MWSAQNLTKIRKRADAKKIKVDSSIFYPAKFVDCEQVSKDPFISSSNASFQNKPYFLKNSAFRSKSIVPGEISKNESKSLYMRKPTRAKEDSRELNNLAMTESYSNLN